MAQDLCKKAQFRYYVVCTVTIYHVGSSEFSLETLMEMTEEERKEKLKERLCPCPQGSVGWFCVGSVREITSEYTHDRLCSS